MRKNLAHSRKFTIFAKESDRPSLSCSGWRKGRGKRLQVMKIYKANIIHTPTKDRFEVFEGGYVAVSDSGLVEGTYQELPAHLQGLPVRDFGNCLLLPAFCDLHVHAPQYRNMGLAMDMELIPWLNTYTFPEEKKFCDLAYAEKIYRRFVHELWMQGSMRSAVFATIHPEATRLLADLFLEAGMGAYVGLVGMNRNCPEDLRNTTDELVSATRDLVAHLEAVARPDRAAVKAILTPRFVPSCTNDMLEALGRLAEEYGLPVQSHLSENVNEIAWVKELVPEAESYGDAYFKYGLFGQTPTLMAHCCYSEGKELELLKRQHVYAVHCPMSNANLASGMAHVRTFLDEGIPVALGSDVSGGNNMSILRSIQYTLQISKLRYAESQGRSANLSLSEAFYLATKSGGSFFGKVGAFEKGYEFDALVVDDSYLNYLGYPLLNRIERFVYLGDDRDIRHRFCKGHEIPEPPM